ncbi:unnamed protein product [Heligmosomoides polygyrus]|uniref:Bestrophin homolog n=1 Tax=Heligmosomoides polygyrus TaxID=6339 RepID=A0A183FA03_HELPZ|nr:unnamed protein product [Heligmosomoides polygyrus]
MTLRTYSNYDITMDKCKPDALDVISEGITCDLFRDLLHCFPARWSDELRTETIGSIGILTYWILVRLLQRSTALGSEDVDHIRRIAYGMKFIWREISKTLFTLKAHCFIDHSTLEDMSESLDVQWLRVGASKTAAASFPGRKDCEETIVKNFVLKKKLIHDLLRQAENTGHRNFIKLSDAIAGEKKRFPPAKILSAEWNFPVHSTVRFSSLDESDAMALRRFYRNISLRSEFRFSFRAPVLFTTTALIGPRTALRNIGRGPPTQLSAVFKSQSAGKYSLENCCCLYMIPYETLASCYSMSSS